MGGDDFGVAPLLTVEKLSKGSFGETKLADWRVLGQRHQSSSRHTFDPKTYIFRTLVILNRFSFFDIARSKF